MGETLILVHVGGTKLSLQLWNFSPPDYIRERETNILTYCPYHCDSGSVFCKTYILTVIEFDTCTEVASITNPKIQDDQKVQISKSEFQISESGKAQVFCPLNKCLHFSLWPGESNFLKGVAIGRNVGKKLQMVVYNDYSLNKVL